MSELDYPLARLYFLLYSGIATIPKEPMDPRALISTKLPRRIPLFFHLKWSKAIDLAPWPAQPPSITPILRMDRLNDLLDVPTFWLDIIFFLFPSVLIDREECFIILFFMLDALSGWLKVFSFYRRWRIKGGGLSFMGLGEK